MCYRYFVLLILFGAFILMNLTLAVIMTKFHEATDIQRQREKEARRQVRRRERLMKLKFGTKTGDITRTGPYVAPAAAVVVLPCQHVVTHRCLCGQAFRANVQGTAHGSATPW